MEQSVITEGKCLFCGKTFSKAAINRHLKPHLEAKTTGNPKKGKSYLVKIEGGSLFFNGQIYFLSLWVDSAATLLDITKFLHDIWLECCKHFSTFTNPAFMKKSFNFHQLMDLPDLPPLPPLPDSFDSLDSLDPSDKENFLMLLQTFADKMMNKIPINQKVNKVFHKDLKLKYDFDFVSLTELELTVLDEYPIRADKKIVLLSRNEPFEWMCDLCQKEPATQVCTVHQLTKEDSLFCDKCAEKHAETCSDFADHASLPVVNSPRMGICAYKGGKIDLERDIFVKNENKQEII
jgi:hypothetical protein